MSRPRQPPLATDPRRQPTPWPSPILAAGVLEEEPRSGICKRTVISGGETPEVPPVYASRPKGAITTLKLNNNAIASLEGLGEALDGTLWEPSQLQFLDLSFNELETIREVGAPGRLTPSR